MGSQTDRSHLRSMSIPIYSEQKVATKDVQSQEEDGKRVEGIKTERDFADWYNELEDGLLEAGYEEYQSCLDDLEMSRSHLDSLLNDTSSTLKLLSSLSESFKAVDTQTSTFQKQCEGLLAAQTRDSNLAHDIQDNLQYYDFLDPVSRRLNAPGAGSSVRGKEFADMLKRLDECLDYMQTHSDQKDAETYRSRYRLLMTRALTLVRGHFVSSLREISSGVSKRIADRQLNDTTMSALLYAKFRVGAAELKEVGLEIQKRAVPPVDLEQGTDSEYQNLLDELHSNFSATRAKLVIPLVRKKLNDISQAPSTSTDLVSFSRASISYIRGICLDEFELWGEWFHGQGGLYDLLEAICEPLYDHLRPRIIHEVKLPKLCELCTLLQTRYLLDAEDEAEYTDPNQLDFAALIQPVLEDTQTRVVFRTQAILRDEIERYKPKPEDLDYPNRNRRASQTEPNNSATAATSGRKRSFAEPFPKTPVVVDDDTGTSADKGARWDFDSQAIFEGWYPTLRKAIWLLSRIYRLVNSTVFDDLAHQIVHQTTLSLQQASLQISSKSSQTDGQLFLIKHLLILKQQIVAFDIEYVTPDISLDFSGVTNTFWELRERGGLFNPRNLVRLVGRGLVPRVVENMLDAKAELDGRLRTVISDFTNGVANQMTSSLPAKVVAEKQSSEPGGGVIGPTCKAIEKGIPTLRQSLDDYLDETRIKETLVAAVQDRVLQIYEEFFNKYASTQSNNGKAVTRNGKGAESSVWDIETFMEWSAQVFRVEDVEYRSSEEEGDDDDDDGPSRSLSRTGSL